MKTLNDKEGGHNIIEEHYCYVMSRQTLKQVTVREIIQYMISMF